MLCRQFGIEGLPSSTQIDRKLWTLAESLLPAQSIEAYTQGLMDLGATRCTRSKPRCDACPVSEGCIARRDGRQAELPTPKAKKTVPERESGFVLISDGRRLLLERRPPSGLWGGLLVPPEGEVKDVLTRLGLALLDARGLPPLRHSFTHFRLTLRPVLCLVEAPATLGEPGLEWVDLAQAADAGVPTPIRKLLRQVASARD